MPEIDDILQQRRERAQRENDRNAMVNGITGGINSNSKTTTGDIIRAIKDQANSIEKLKPKADQNLNLHIGGLGLSIDALNIPGMTDMLALFSDQLEDLSKQNKQLIEKSEQINQKYLKAQQDLTATIASKMSEMIAAVMNIEIPEPVVHVQPPTVNVPKAEVKVSVPPANIKPRIEVQAPNIESRITEEREIYDTDGRYDGYEEKYADGTKHTVSGYARGRIKHKWG